MAGVVVCHGSTVVRERIVLTALGVPSLAPVRAAASADELITLARRVPPSIVLLDAHLASPGPVEAIRRLRTVTTSAMIVMLAVPGDEVALDRAVAVGARGYLAPDVGRAELAAVAAHVLASPALPVGPGGGATAVRPGEPEPEQPGVPTQGTGEVQLTKREIEVLVGMSNGRSNAQIGGELFLSEDTVKTHARRLFRKLGASDRAQAVAIGLRRGLIR
ncbi:response regulator transcription factor [Cellulomonas hominis]